MASFLNLMLVHLVLSPRLFTALSPSLMSAQVQTVGIDAI